MMCDENSEMPDVVTEYISPEELKLLKQLETSVETSARQCEIAGFNQQKAHAEMRAAEAELRAAQAEYNGTIMKLLWQYKLEKTDSIGQTDGLITRGKVHEQDDKDDTSSESEESKRDG